MNLEDTIASDDTDRFQIFVGRLVKRECRAAAYHVGKEMDQYAPELTQTILKTCGIEKLKSARSPFYYLRSAIRRQIQHQASLRHDNNTSNNDTHTSELLSDRSLLTR